MFPVTGRRGDLLALRDGSGARARERHRGAERGTGGTRTEARHPGGVPVTPLPAPTRQRLQGRAGPFTLRAPGKAVVPRDGGVDSLRVWKLQELSPRTRDRLCGGLAALGRMEQLCGGCRHEPCSVILAK